MSKYVFSIKNYHAIEDATISIDGITVLAGINGCGKSTLSRWLYYIINTSNNFDKIQRLYFTRNIIRQVERISRLFKSTPNANKYKYYSDSFRNIISDDIDFNKAIADLFASFTLQAEKDLETLLNESSPMATKRALNFLFDEEIHASNNKELIKEYFRNLETEFNRTFDLMNQSILNKSIDKLSKCIKNEYGEYDDMPKDISFFEDGINILDSHHFSEPLMLNRAIYIDTPMALSKHASFFDSENLWSKFRDLLIYKNENSDSLFDNKEIQFIFQRTINGNIKLEEDDLAFSKELHYIREDGLNIKLEDAATGIKSFAYIFRLIDNGWLNKNTVLMIDEPEAHLHPQWIVEFAKLLVLLHKHIGVKIVIASHNPDMISAIHDISEYYDIEKSTTFFIAEKKDYNQSQYIFRNVGHEISDIFESFNIALIKIQNYSTPDKQ